MTSIDVVAQRRRPPVRFARRNWDAARRSCAGTLSSRRRRTATSGHRARRAGAFRADQTAADDGNVRAWVWIGSSASEAPACQRLVGLTADSCPRGVNVRCPPVPPAVAERLPVVPDGADSRPVMPSLAGEARNATSAAALSGERAAVLRVAPAPAAYSPRAARRAGGNELVEHPRVHRARERPR